MQWSLRRCPQAQFLFKTDDDVLVNPWTLRKVLKENEDAKLLGKFSLIWEQAYYYQYFYKSRLKASTEKFLIEGPNYTMHDLRIDPKMSCLTVALPTTSPTRMSHSAEKLKLEYDDAMSYETWLL